MTEQSTYQSEFDFRLDLLLEEIEYIHQLLKHYDNLSFKLKGWAVTLWSGIVAFGAGTGIHVVVLASIPVSLTFWLVDGYFKRYQRRSMVRMGAIEQFLEGEGPFAGEGLRQAFVKRDIGRFPVHDPIAGRTRRLSPDLDRRYLARTNLRACFTVPNVAVFYLIPIVSAAVIYLVLGVGQHVQPH